jgi:hypothetical protein
MQPLVSVRQSLDRPLDRQRTVLDITEKPHFAASAPFRVFPLGDVKSYKNFAMLSQGPSCVPEARLGQPEQPSFLPHTRAGHRRQPANMTSNLKPTTETHIQVAVLCDVG